MTLETIQKLMERQTHGSALTAENSTGFIRPHGDVVFEVRMPRSQVGEALSIGELALTLLQQPLGMFGFGARFRIMQFAIYGW